MENICEWPVDQSLIDAATQSLQGHEKLSSLIRKELSNNPLASKAIEDTNTILDSLRNLKSSIEGTSFAFRPISINHDQLALLRHLVLSHVPSHLHKETKDKIHEKVKAILEGQVKRILYSCIITCPWFASAQEEESAAAKNNLLFVVYVARDEQFFSLATPHEKELCETIDTPPLFACEVRHLLHQALRASNVRCMEALLSPPEAVVYTSPEFSQISQLVDPLKMMSRTFVDRCVGQAFGALVRKNQHKGKWIVRDEASLSKFSDSFRLLKYAESAIMRMPLIVWREIDEASCNDEEEKEIFFSLKQAFDGLIHKEKLLQLVLTMKNKIEQKMDTLGKSPPYWSDQLGEWLTSVRMDGVTLSQAIDPATSIAANLRSLLDSEGLPDVAAQDVIAIARAGSQMYNLALPTSDTDYIIIYKEPTEQLISRCSSLKESLSTRGQQAEVESASYEIRLFCEMLLKGAVNMFELLFADNMEYSSHYWQQLIPHKHSFMSEKVILQYIGFIKTHKKLIDSKKHMGKPRDRKLFYQIFHKLLSLESYVNGGDPVVKCEGEDREFILRVRRGPLEGDLDRDALIRLAEERLQRVKDQLLERRERYREYGDYRILQTWLLHVRGITLKEPLKMTTPPLVP